MLPVHAIGGLPRSGSTLLCNLLAQNPAIRVTDTDALPGVLRAMVSTWSSSPEVKHKLERDPEAAYEQITRALRGALEGWAGPAGEGVELHISKSRGWTWQSNLDVLQDLAPAARLLCCVRNPLNVFASLERRYRQRPGLDDEGGRLLEARANDLFAGGGLIGRSIAAVNDLLDRQADGVLFVKAELLTAEPGPTLALVYAELGLEYSDGVHRFTGVENRSDEPDAFYLFKHPHEGAGDVRALDDDEWRDVFSEAFARRILANRQVARLCDAFGYNRWSKPQTAPAKARARRVPKWAKQR